MGYLEKHFLLHERGAAGQPLPIDREIEGFGMVRFLPFTRGEILDISSETTALVQKGESSVHIWEKFVLDHLFEPKLTIEDLRNSKPIYRNGIYKDIIMDILLPALKEISGMQLATPQEEEEALKKD